MLRRTTIIRKEACAPLFPSLLPELTGRAKCTSPGPTVGLKAAVGATISC
jgi:hypothetical protein